ncbi:MAG: hypothetical protein WA713_14205, partial [Candidatus Acidiferrales bacterium]
MNRRAFLKNLSGLGASAALAELAGIAPPHLSRFTANLAAAAAVGAQPSPQQQQAANPTFRLIDVTNSAGIHFHHNSGAYGGKLLPETLGSGCAFLDYDADGWQDILLINGMDWPGHK